MKNSVAIQVRFRDLDAYGHVNNAAYLSYLETGRVALTHDMFLRDMKLNIQYLLTRIDLQYLQPILLSDTVYVDCWFSEVGKVRFKISYKVHDGNGKIYAVGYSEHALFNGNTGRPMRLPEDWKELEEPER